MAGFYKKLEPVASAVQPVRAKYQAIAILATMVSIDEIMYDLPVETSILSW